MPIRHRDRDSKNAMTWPRRSCLLTTTVSAASMPWTWNTFLAISKPIVVICMWRAPLSDSSDDNHPMALRCRKRAPSTTSKAAVSDRSKAAPLFDDLVGAGEQRGGHVETENSGSLGVDD